MASAGAECPGEEGRIEWDRALRPLLLTREGAIGAEEFHRARRLGAGRIGLDGNLGLCYPLRRERAWLDRRINHWGRRRRGGAGLARSIRPPIGGRPTR